MNERIPHARAWSLSWAVAIVLLAASYGVYETRRGDWIWTWSSVPLTTISADGGFAFSSTVDRSDAIFGEQPVPAIVVEDARGLFPSNAPIADIQAKGHGRYRIDGRTVRFSSLDGSDPRDNGRRYYLWFSPVNRAVSRLVYGVTAPALGVAMVFSAWLLSLGVTRRVLVSRLVGAPGAITAGAKAALGNSDRFMHRRFGRRGALVWLVTLSILALLAVVSSQTIFLMRLGQWTSLWRQAEVQSIEPEHGFAFRASTGRDDIGSQYSPSPAAMFEDGRQLGLRNALHSDIREVGLGRYSFWYDYVYFASSDNSDPRTNGRHYTFSYPPVSRGVARAVYAASGGLVVLTAVFAAMVLRSRVLGETQARLLAGLRARGVMLLVGAGALSLVVVGFMRASDAMAPLVTPFWTITIVLNVIAAALCYAQFGRRMPAALVIACTIAVAASFYLLTVWAPHRSQGCHTTDPLPVWSAFCVAPDSASYYFGYTVGSTRQPLYPWFIGALTAGTGFNPPKYYQTTTAGGIRQDPSDPLFIVVRAQIVLLLGAGTLAAFLVMRWLGSPLAALVFVGLYDQQFFSANELNIVLTEPLVQTFTMLTVAMLAAFFGRMRPAALLLAAAAGGLAYLTRQAAVYVIIPLGAMMLASMFEDWQRWWRWCASALVVFALICAVPDFYVFAKTGSFSRQQDSLQYQYRIAHALQYATLRDLELMPDEKSRAWLADAVERRDRAHRAVEEKFAGDELNRMIYYIAANLYEVATPIDGSRPAETPAFYMNVATPILKRHIFEYARFSFRFWQFGMTRPGLARLAISDFSAWYSYAVLFGLVCYTRSRNALAALALVLGHWAAVAIICLAAVPIPRMIGASEYFVVVAALVLAWEAATRAATAGRRAATALPT